MPYPRMLRIRQRFDRPRVEDIPSATRESLQSLGLERTIRPGQTVALTAGSRGIANIPLILQSVVRFLRDLGARPFLVPAMGSHGGGTADGQRRLLESYGITESVVGAPLHASMEVVALGTTSEGYPVVLDREAAVADHIGVVARIKPHTGFHGPIESGLLKMLMIGLGKHQGALAYHRLLLEEPFDRVVRSVARHICQTSRITFGLAVLENAYDETALIEALPPARFEAREEALLDQAKRWLARLPYPQADLLIVDEIGKDISGSGMDTNVVGRKRAFNVGPPAGQPNMRHIFVRGLSDRAHGNATGIGLADFTTMALVRAMDYEATVINCLTAGYPEGARLPVQFETDREVIDAALAIIGRRSPGEARVMHIRNTLCLDEMAISEAYLADAGERTWSAISEPAPMRFDSHGKLAAAPGSALSS